MDSGQKNIEDASSRFQNSLPISSDELLKKLDKWNIAYKCYNHVPLKTVEESKLTGEVFYMNKKEEK